MRSVTGLEARIKYYADARWPKRTIKDQMKKLGEEFLELMQAVAEDEPADILVEAADVAILLADICQFYGQSLEGMMEAKVDVLYERLEMVESYGRELLNEEIGG